MRKFFARQSRLARSKDFQRVFQGGRRVVKAYLVVYLCPNQLGYARLGTIVPKKVIALSTQRHQLKRIMRESFRLNQAHLVGYDVIIRLRYKPDMPKLVRSTLEHIWRNLHS